MESEWPYRWAILALLATVMTFGPYHRIKAYRAGGRVSRRGEGWFILLGLRFAALFWFVGQVAYVIDPATMAWAQVGLPAWLRWAGFGVCCAALVLLWAMFRALGTNLTDTVATRPGATLVTTGPYRSIRHPMYAALILLTIGLSLLTANLYLAAAGLVVLGFLRLRTPIEEANLLARFGDQYRAYRARTGAIVPRLGRASAGAEPGRSPAKPST